MSETAIVLVKQVKELKTGTSSKGNWTLYGLIDGNEEIFGTWFNSTTLKSDAEKLANEKAEVEFDPQDGGKRTIKSVKPAAKEAEVPPLGTGEYVKGQTAPSDARRILGCVAWEHAVKLADVEMRHTVGREITPAMVLGAAEHYANQIFMDLLRKGRIMEDEDIPL